MTSVDRPSLLRRLLGRLRRDRVSQNVSRVPSQATDATPSELSARLLRQLESGQGFRTYQEVMLGEQLRQLLMQAVDVHANAFSPQRYRDLLTPILAKLNPEDLQGATIVDLSCGDLNPFTLSFVLLMLGAERAYAVDREPIQSMETAVRAMATATGWLLLQPQRVVGDREITAEQVLRNLKGFEVPLLAAGDPAGISPRRLIHLVESMPRLTVGDEEADVVFSMSLLEHLHPIDEAIQSLQRITKPGGLGIHVVDLIDHRFYSGEVASAFEFLKEPESDSLVHGSNRLRVDDFSVVFERHGFAVERVEKWENVAPPTMEEQERFAEPFRSMPLEAARTTGARIFVRRGGKPPVRRERRGRPAAAPLESFRRSEQPPTGAEEVNDDRYRQIYRSVFATATGERGSEYVALNESGRPPSNAHVKLIAFYLPQFHPIPENDAWWGRGFTEWTNVSKAVPQFLGHHQPHLPGELGFYDLRVPEVQRRQVELAKLYGLSGFCFYYYWFAGKRLLERPLTQFVADPSIDFPFCLCWANENWTRRWDGREDQILVEQQHTDETDAAFIADIEPFLWHRNYIRIHGRPVLMVYRPTFLLNPGAAAGRWREHCRKVGLPNPYLIAVEAFESVDPATLGFDAAVEFPANTAGRPLPTDITRELDVLNASYEGAVYRYTDMMAVVDRPRPAYQLFRGVVTGFDNEPRRPGRGSTYAFASPASYGRWLETACRTTLAEPDPDKRLVFINAWNEWAEGAHLEPDRRYGYAYLDMTARVLERLADPWTILFVSHDACRGGAQLVLLDFLAWLREHTSIRLRVLCLDGGEWLPRFQQLADTVVLTDIEAQAARAHEADITTPLLDFCGGKPALVYANSVASGRAFAALRKLKAPILTHVHELETSIERYAAAWIDDVLAGSAHYVACSEAVRQNLLRTHRVAPASVTTVHSSIRLPADVEPPTDEERTALRLRLGLPTDKRLIMGCGIGMPFRKGADLFIDVGHELRRRGREDVDLCWIGEFSDAEHDPEHGTWSDHVGRLQGENAPPVRFLGLKDDPKAYLRAGDVFLLPSREDPFPLVALEAAACGLPIVCFDKAGGMPTVVDEDAGHVVPYEDVAAMAERTQALLDDDADRRKRGTRAREKVLSRFTTDFTAPHLLSTCRRVAGQKPSVSVIVPNYNHARYLPQRLESVFNQTFRDFEVILLDDASSDDSVHLLEGYRDRADTRIVVNERNSGSTFKQWLKGLALARAEIVWIAESDDSADPQLIEALLPAFRDPRVKLAYANSHVINDHGEVVGDYTTTDYLTSLSRTKWHHAYQVSAEEEVNEALGVKNTILSASAVLFRRFELEAAAIGELEEMRMAGDWYFFIHAIAGGDVYYTPRKLNYHRRHDESVIGTLLKENRVEQFFREFYAVQRQIFDRYPLDEEFAGKWERYLRDQWDAFFPGRSFDDLERYYPVGPAREQIRSTKRTGAGSRVIGR